MKRMMKYVGAMCILLCVLFSIDMTTMAAENTIDFMGGSGTANDPYLISNKRHLDNVRNYLDSHFKLVADIEFTEEDFEEGGSFYNDGEGWIPIGYEYFESSNINLIYKPAGYRPSKAFVGSLDGDSYTISGLYSRIGGLIGSNSGEIRDLGITGVDIIGRYNTDYGGLCSINYGTIYQCYVTGKIFFDNPMDLDELKGKYPLATLNSGGICFKNSGRIKNCYSDVEITVKHWNYENVTSRNNVGGICAKNYYGVIENCYNLGNISSLYSNMGGICAVSYWGSIENSYNKGTISGTSVAGIACEIELSDISACYNVGILEPSGYDAAGICVESNNSAIFQCFNFERAGYNIVRRETDTSLLQCYRLGAKNTVYTGTGKSIACTDEEMKSQDVYEGFDFENGWIFDASKAYPFPILRNNPFECENNTDEFAGGIGTKFNPFLVTEKEHFDNVKKYPYSFFKQMKDITFLESDFKEGGAFYNEGKGFLPMEAEFYGGYDGNGYSISGIYMNQELKEPTGSETVLGIFGDSRGNLKNISIKDIDFNVNIGISDCWGYIGTICGRGRVEKCVVSGNMKIIKEAKTPQQGYMNIYVGGITGTGAATQCKSEIDIQMDCLERKNSTGVINVGGIAGGGSAIDECVNQGNIQVDWPSKALYRISARIGGIVGEDALVTKCYNEGNITANIATGDSSDESYLYMGGIIGCASLKENVIAVENCYNLGKVTADCLETFYWNTSTHLYAGGIIGCWWFFDDDAPGEGQIKNCYNLGSVWSDLFYGSIGGRKEYDIFDQTDSSDIALQCYYLDNVNKNVCVDAVKCTEEQMQDMTTYEGFDFETVWFHDYYGDFKYPQLKALAVNGIKAIEPEKDYPKTITTIEGMNPELPFDVIITYEDGSEKRVPAKVGMLTGFEVDRIGAQEVAFSYCGVQSENTVTVRVVEKELASIEVSAMPKKTKYVLGVEEFNADGGKIRLHYNNHTSEEIDLTSDMVTGFAKAELGNNHLNVVYGGKETSLLVTMVKISSIKIQQLPSKIDYIVGEPLNLTGGKMSVVYSDSTKEVLDLSKAEFEYDNTLIGTVEVTAKYGDAMDVFHIKTCRRVLVSVSLIEPIKLSYKEGDALDLSGGKLIATYKAENSESSYKLEVDLKEEMITNYDPAKIGIQTLTVKYGEWEGVFIVRVKKSIEVYTDLVELKHDGISNKPQVVIAGLTEGKDYEVSYDYRVGEEIGTVNITGIGEYAGRIQKGYELIREITVTRIFSDVYYDWYVDYVQYVYDYELMTGIKGTTRFEPNSNITKAQVAQVLYNMESQPAVTNQKVFTDLKDVYSYEWYANAVAWAYNTGVVTGDTNAKKFFPNADVTREQLAIMMYRYAQYKGYDTSKVSNLSGLKNAGNTADWALAGVKWAVGQGLISGIEKDGVKDLAPQGNASRAQVAAILQRFCDAYDEK